MKPMMYWVILRSELTMTDMVLQIFKVSTWMGLEISSVLYFEGLVVLAEDEAEEELDLLQVKHYV